MRQAVNLLTVLGGSFGLMLSGSCAEEPVDESLVAGLAAAIENRRVLEPRLTGGDLYQPCLLDRNDDLIPQPSCSEALRPGTSTFTRLSRLTSHIRHELADSPSVDALHFRGLWNLVRHDREASSERAVRDLETAVEESPDDARIHSDLAAAYYTRAQDRGVPEDLLKALAHAERALQLDDTLVAAIFNRALVLQRLQLPMAAADAWRDYLAVDGVSGWATDAERFIRSLEETGLNHVEEPRGLLRRAAARVPETALREMVDLHRQETRELVEQELLPEWATAWASNKLGAANLTLDAARRLSKALADQGGDRVAIDAVTAIEQALASGGTVQLRSLMEGHLLLEEGRNLYNNSQPTEAGQRFVLAERHLRNGGSVGAEVALFWEACSAYRRGEYDQALRLLDRLSPLENLDAYPSLLGQVRWVRGLIWLIRGEPLVTLGDYSEALRQFTNAGEIENTAALRGLLAECLETIGRLGEAWQIRYRSLLSTAELSNPRRLLLVYSTTADAALRLEHADAARYFLDEAVRHATALGSPSALADALAWRSLAWSRLGEPRRALEDAEAAQESADQILDEETRTRALADLQMLEGNALADDDPGRAIETLSSALDYYQEIDHHFLGASMIYGVRARAHRHLGDTVAAEENLRAAIESHVRHSGKAAQPLGWLSFLGETQRLFDELIALQALDLQRPDLAFETLEQANLATLVSLEPDDSARLSALDLAARLPQHTVLIAYRELEDQILSWSLARDGLTFQLLPARRNRLRRLMTDLLQPIDAASEKSAEEELYELLVAPWSARVAASTTLCFIPHRDLYDLPFARLRIPAENRYLIEDHSVVLAPTASGFIRALTRDREGQLLAAKPAAGLVFGVSTVDASLLPFGLDPLPAVGREAHTVAQYLHQPRLFADADATRQAFLRHAPSAEILHFAGHAVANPYEPLLSFLLFSPNESGDSGVLYARDLASLDLRRARLVVMSACNTATTLSVGADSIGSLARAFLRAGATTVVATRAAVDDEVAYRMLEAFYNHLSIGLDAPSALRAAQLDLLANEDPTLRHPATWSAFQVIQGPAY